MSIATKKGDLGSTGLMYNRRVSKCHPRVEACGCVDELNAALGLARAWARDAFLRDNLFHIQKDLVVLMGELATAAEDLTRYDRDGFPRLNQTMLARLDDLVQTVESQQMTFRGWATPGGSQVSAALDLSRTVCRRAERRVCALQETDQLDNPTITMYLNRLSDTLWLLARWAEAQPPPDNASLQAGKAS